MIGENKLILSDATMAEVIENYFKNTLFKEMDFKVTDFKHSSYENQWEITLESKEAREDIQDRAE